MQAIVSHRIHRLYQKISKSLVWIKQFDLVLKILTLKSSSLGLDYLVNTFKSKLFSIKILCL